MLMSYFGFLVWGFLCFFAATGIATPTRPVLRARSTPEWPRNIDTGNQTLANRNSSSQFAKRDGTKYVFMHVILGNTYPYVVADWKADFQLMESVGIDAVALNIGSDPWQATQIQNAYDAAVGTTLKLFISFDFTAMSCDLPPIVSRVNQYASHPNQFTYEGKVFISSFSGDCLGIAGWKSLKAQTNGYVMPFIWGLEGQFNSWSCLDSWYCWGAAWPQTNADKTTADDLYYIGQLGSRYATTVSGWIYTHFSYKNFYLRGDDWLIVNRWEQLFSLRDQLTFVEMVTWNDFGESDYFGPIKGAQPDGTTWATGFPHLPWLYLSAYYITAYKTGSYPPITEDVIYFWARPHPAAATASGDSLGKPTGWDWTQDTMWAAVFTTQPATVILKCGSSSQSFNVGSGVNKLSIPLAPGKMTVQMIRSSQTIISYTPDDYTFITNPVYYNYNAWVGSATASGSSTPTTTSSTGTTTTTTTTPASTPTTTTTTTSSTPPTTTTTSSPRSTTLINGYNYLHCYQDASSRVLSQSSSVNSQQTLETCIAKCAGGGYSYAGVEYADECYCSNSLSSTAVQAPETDCSMACAGNSSQQCGGSWRIGVYQVATEATASWKSYGCVAEGTTGSRRALNGASYGQSGMTPQVCQGLCSAYKYAGVEYATECYCGNTLTNNGATGAIIDSSNCNMGCGGDSSQKCGGSWTLSVYSMS